MRASSARALPRPTGESPPKAPPAKESYQLEMQPLPPHEMNDAAELPLAAARACPLLLVKPCLPSLY